jgi:hypothetical protein
MSDGREAYWDIPNWRMMNNAELKNYIETKYLAGGIKRKGGKGGAIVIRTTISTLDMYTYLKGRFGNPNGMLTAVASDDSDNLFHWDYVLKAGSYDLTIIGANREVHVWTQVDLKDAEWWSFIKGIRNDFSRTSSEKGAATKELEKWRMFTNKYALVADQAEKSYTAIKDEMGRFAEVKPSSKDNKIKERERMSKRAHKLFGACLELRLLTPVMAESFVNMLILYTCKDEVRSDKRQYDAFVRSNIDLKIIDMFYKCKWFAKAPKSTDAEFKAFMSVWNKRNDTLHGNVDPERDAFEVVYFDGKRPLHVEAGDPIASFYATLEKTNNPVGAVTDYETVHEFTSYLLDCLHPRIRDEVFSLMQENTPGWRADTKRFGRLFPDHIATAYWRIRYDDELADQELLETN